MLLLLHQAFTLSGQNNPAKMPSANARVIPGAINVLCISSWVTVKSSVLTGAATAALGPTKKTGISVLCSVKCVALTVLMRLC
ncbi:hypothetical protein SUGI_0380310 [Cryptomeria japonica]|nr:hypothetical protein SUGI_0380310 [Cryptomeria japonica]